MTRPALIEAVMSLNELQRIKQWHVAKQVPDIRQLFEDTFR